MTKTICEGSGQQATNVRPYDGGSTVSDRLGRCGWCGRILRPTPKGLFREHQPKGKTTASMDKTMESLWDMAGTKQIVLTVPIEYNPTFFLVVDAEGDLYPPRGNARSYSGLLLGKDGREIVELGEYDGALGALLKDAGKIIREHA